MIFCYGSPTQQTEKVTQLISYFKYLISDDHLIDVPIGWIDIQYCVP